MTKKKILIITHELAPYTCLSDQSTITRDIALAFQRGGNEIRVFMPKFGIIKERKHRLHEVIRLSGLNIPVGTENNPLIIKVASLQTAKIQVYFLDNQDFFERKDYFTDSGNKFFEDNDDRIVFFNKAVMELMVKLGWKPDIIHCHGWMGGLVPLYSKTVYQNEPVLKDVKILYSIVDSEENHDLGEKFVNKANLNGILNSKTQPLQNPKINDLCKIGMQYADAVVYPATPIQKETSDFMNSCEKKLFQMPENVEKDLYEKYFSFISSF
jgi:starch synthase